MERQISESFALMLDNGFKGVHEEFEFTEHGLLDSTRHAAAAEDLVNITKHHNVDALLSELPNIRAVLGAKDIRVFDDEGLLLADGYYNASLEGQSAADKDMLTRALRAEDVSATISELSGIEFEVFVPIKASGKLVGVLNVTRLLDYDLLTHMKNEFGIEIVVYNNDLPQASTIKDADIFSGSNLKALIGEAKTIQKKIDKEITIGGLRYYVAAIPMKLDNERLGVMAVAMSSEKSYRERIILKLALLPTVLVLLLSSFYMSRRVSLKVVEPIKQLSKVTQEISEGSLSTVVDIKSEGEVGVLADSFNKMLIELRKHREHLNELVEEKTRELTRTNEDLLKEMIERKKAQAQKELTSRYLQNIADNVPGAIYQFRLRPDGSACFPYASAAFKEIYRVDPELVKEDASVVFSLLHPDDYNGVFASVRQSAETLTHWQHEARLVFDDGTVRWVLGNAMPQREQDGSVLFQGFITDVTERKHMEMSLSEKLSLSKLISEIDIILSLNKSMGDMLQRCSELIVEYLEMAFIRIWIIDESTNSLELKSSAGIYTHINGGHAKIPVGMYKIGLIAEEAKPHLTNSVQTDPRVSNKEWALKEGMVAFAGYPLIFEEKVLGVIAGFSKSALSNSVLEVLGSISYNISIAVKNKQAEDELHRAKEYAENTARDLIVINSELEDEIHKRKQIEAALVELNRTLEERVKDGINKIVYQEQMLIQQSKMAAMGEMIGLIAHQWRQPLNAIGLMVQDLKDAYAFGEIDQPFIEQLVNAAMTQINFMSKTIDDFRDFFKPSKKKLRFNVKKNIEEILSMFALVFNKSDIEVSMTAASDIALFTEGYPNEFKQVVLNIINNSKDAIASKELIKRGQIEIAIGNDRDKITIAIRDNGGGIPPDIIGKIFEPYYTTKGKEGTGLGLYMSKTIVETNMGGTLAVSNTGDGAEFVISLNAVDSR
ncbi:MAG: ATP-binding protein [Candidatus Magnetominusculus sp. LBB02]|nr:ATP-binding protein [Candidatus Magnetominusculus sp. LBB02]